MGRNLCEKNYLLEKDDEVIQSHNKIPDDENPKHSFSKDDDIRMLSCWFIPPSSMTLCNSKNKPLQITRTLLWVYLRHCEQLEFYMLKPFNSIIKSNTRLKKHLIKSYVLKIRA